MRVLLIFMAITMVILLGCGVDVLTSTATSGEMNKRQTQSAVGVLNHVKRQTSQLSAQSAVDVYQAEKGHYPPSLEALVPDYLPAVPQKPDGSAYRYDPTTGRLLD